MGSFFHCENFSPSLEAARKFGEQMDVSVLCLPRHCRGSLGNQRPGAPGGEMPGKPVSGRRAASPSLSHCEWNSALCGLLLHQLLRHVVDLASSPQGCPKWGSLSLSPCPGLSISSVTCRIILRRPSLGWWQGSPFYVCVLRSCCILRQHKDPGLSARPLTLQHPSRSEPLACLSDSHSSRHLLGPGPRQLPSVGQRAGAGRRGLPTSKGLPEGRGRRRPFRKLLFQLLVPDLRLSEHGPSALGPGTVPPSGRPRGSGPRAVHAWTLCVESPVRL